MNILSLSVLSFFYSDMFSTLFSKKKVLFLSVSSQKKAGVRECRQESEKRGGKSDHRERKRSFDGFGERGIVR